MSSAPPRVILSPGASTPAPAEPPAVAPSPAPATEEVEPAEPEEVLSRPERQWRWIREATDDTCRDRLSESKAEFQPLPDRERPDANGCGIPRGVVVRVGPTGMRYSPPLRVDCSFAMRLAEIEEVLKDETARRFGAEVVRIGTLGSYACRGVIGRLRGLSGGVSEHSLGNAVDVTHFDLSSGRRVSVLKHFPRDRGPAVTEEARFLRELVRRVWRELGMRALGPDFDKSHRDHLHFDAGSRWWW